METILAVLPAGSTALIVSGALALVTIAAGRRVVRDDAGLGESPLG
ncbi:MAG: hypothetical protein DHS20C19_13810 [Acidimicrobiales bacterium]|nr:MAG: hypothetical protein DHS20C19_13810 [Acidimicrobiales bacterium]